MKIKINKKFKIFLIVLLFGIGFYLRMMNYLSFTAFNGDEGNHFLIFDNFIRFGKLGITGEGSSFFGENLFFHNLPYSIYFEAIIFIISGQFPLIYMFCYVLLSLLLVWLIWQTACNFFNEKTGLMALFLMIFSRQAILDSTFASQPTNAILFEASSFYFYSLFYKNKKKSLFLSSFVSGIFALHMYPPMYLFLPIKILFLFINFRKKIAKNKKLLFICLTILVLSYLPLLINEFNYYGQESSDLWNVKQFILDQSHSANKSLPNLTSYVQRFWLILKSTTDCLDNNFYTLAAPFWIVVIFSLFFIQKDKKNITIYLFLSLITPMLLIAWTPININPEFLSRTYFNNSFLYIVLISATAASRTNKLFCIMIFIIIVFNLKKPAKIDSINFFEKREIADKIINDSQERLLPLEEVNIRVLNNKYGNNDGNWDNSIYWYFLQRKNKKQLVSITYPFLTPDVMTKKVMITYLICENYAGSLKKRECQNKAHYLYPENIIQDIFYSEKIGVVGIY